MRYLLTLALLAACGGSTSTAELTATDSSGAVLAMEDFGPTAEGATVERTITLTNSGDAATGLLGTSITGPFALAVTSTCPGATLPVGESCTLDVTFSANTLGTQTGELTISSPSGGTLTIPLTALVLTPMLEVTPTSVAFGAIAIGMVGTETIHIANVGGTTATLSAPSATGTGYAITTSTCTTTLPASASCDATVEFTPSVIGAQTGMFAIDADGVTYSTPLAGSGAGQVSVVLAGTGTGSVASTPSAIACPTACSSAFDDMVTLVATPGADSIVTGWSVSGCTGTTCVVTPTIASQTVTVTFTSTLTSVFLTPESHDFGLVNIATSTAPQTFQLVNPTANAVALGAFTASDGFIVVDTTCGLALAADSNCTIRVAFHPRDVGPATGVLDAAVDGAHVTTSLSGVGGKVVQVTVVGSGVVTSSPSGISCGTSCTGLFATDVTLTATPAPGGAFSSWSIPDCSGTTCIVPTGTNVTATFVQSGAATLTVTMSVPGQVRVVDTNTNTQVGMCTSTCILALTTGHTIEVTGATTSRFDGLTGACTSTAVDGQCTFLASGDALLTAGFTADLGERFTLLGPYPGSGPQRVAFDDDGHLIVVDNNSITAFSSAGALLWTKTVSAESFVVSGTVIYAATGTNLVSFDGSGNILSTVAFTAHLDTVAASGDLIGRDGANTATEWATNGSFVRVLPFTGAVSGVDATGVIYQLQSTTDDSGGTPVSSFTAARATASGVALSALPGIVATSERGSAGLSIGPDYLFGYETSLFSHMGPISLRITATDGTLIKEFDIARTVTGDLPMMRATSAGHDRAGTVYVPMDGAQFNMAIQRLDRAGSVWTATTSVRNASYAGFFPTAIVGGPHGELAVIGSYQALFDYSLGAAPMSTFIQTFY